MQTPFVHRTRKGKRERESLLPLFVRTSSPIATAIAARLLSVLRHFLKHVGSEKLTPLSATVLRTLPLGAITVITIIIIPASLLFRTTASHCVPLPVKQMRCGLIENCFSRARIDLRAISSVQQEPRKTATRQEASVINGSVRAQNRARNGQLKKKRTAVEKESGSLG